MNLRCRSAVQPAWRLRVGAVSNSGMVGAGTMSATSSTILSLVAMSDSFGWKESHHMEHVRCCRTADSAACLPERCRGPVPFPSGGFVDHVPFELARHPHGAVAAHADEADAAPGQMLDRRNADLLGEAVGDDLAFVEAKKQDTAHLFCSRLAAAMASPRLL